MLVTVHTAFSAATTKKLSSLWAIGIIAFFAHFILDSIPHGDWIWGRVGLALGIPDLVLLTLGLLFYSVFTKKLQFKLYAAAIGSLLPDLLWVLALFAHWRWLVWFNNLHAATHQIIGNNLVSGGIGYGIQALTLLISLYYLFRKPKIKTITVRSAVPAGILATE